MSKDLEIKIKTIINYDIPLTEVLTSELKKKRIREFEKNLSLEKYMWLFEEVENYLLNPDVEDKEHIIKLILDLIGCYSKFNEHWTLMPMHVQKIYLSSERLHTLSLKLNFFLESSVFIELEFEETLKQYLDFLNKPENEFYIQNCYSKICDFNKRIIDGLNVLDHDGIRKEDKVINLDLLNQFKSVINDLDTKRSV